MSIGGSFAIARCTPALLRCAWFSSPSLVRFAPGSGGSLRLPDLLRPARTALARRAATADTSRLPVPRERLKSRPLHQRVVPACARAIGFRYPLRLARAHGAASRTTTRGPQL